MPILLRCSSCQKPLKVKEELAGKKVKCPSCGTPVPVPLPEVEEELEAVVEEIQEQPAKPAKPAAVTAKPRREDKVANESESEGADSKAKGAADGSEWVPCPNCGSTDVKRVKSTFWGASLGPKLFNHVRCRQCRTAYNGKTGGSNILPALGCLFIFFIALSMIAAALGALIYLKRINVKEVEKAPLMISSPISGGY